MKDSKKTIEINTVLTGLAEDIASLMLREHQSIHDELEHIGHLINDASTTLTTSFDELNSITAKQQVILNKAQQENSEDNPSSNKQNNLDGRFKKNQLKIVTALQFDDIVQQLTKHAQSRTRHIQLMFKKLADSIEDSKKLDYEYTQEFNEKITTLKREVNELRKELEKENPVKQSSLAIGKTELF
jgi:uncharacterized protein Yka (UPF0111/DUF47 family)